MLNGTRCSAPLSHSQVYCIVNISPPAVTGVLPSQFAHPDRFFFFSNTLLLHLYVVIKFSSSLELATSSWRGGWALAVHFLSQISTRSPQSHASLTFSPVTAPCLVWLKWPLSSATCPKVSDEVSEWQSWVCDGLVSQVMDFSHWILCCQNVLVWTFSIMVSLGTLDTGHFHKVINLKTV